jgi:Ca2+-binding RTX toxin-like protein
MSSHRRRTRRRALAVGAVAGLTVFAAASTGSALAATTAQIQGTTLQITGNSASDKVALIATPTQLIGDVGEDGTADFTFDRSAFNTLNFNAGAGNDEIRLQGLPLDGVAVTLDGDLGKDSLFGGPGAETLIGGPGNDFVDGNIGADIARLGDGDDHFQWDPGDGSDTVEGEAGNDTLDFNGSNIGENIDVSANGSRVRLFRDIAQITMDLNGIEAAKIRSLGGADNTTIGDLTGTGMKTVDDDLAGFDGAADASADNVTVTGTENADKVSPKTVNGITTITGLSPTVSVHGGDPTLDQVTVKTLGGADTITGGVGLSGLRGVVFDGGADTDKARYSGTTGPDTIGIARDGVDTVAAFDTAGALLEIRQVESLEIAGGDGADAIAGQNGIAGLTNLTITGGAGDDQLFGGDGNDLLLGGDGADFVDGNRGNDVARLGTGDDHFQWDPGDGSDTVEGEGGTDALDFNGSNIGEEIDLSADDGRLRLLRNIAGIAMDGHGLETVNIRALGGADEIFVDNMTNSEVRNVNLDLSQFGGGGDATTDTVTVGGTSAADTVNVATDSGQPVVSGLAAKTRILGSEPTDLLEVDTFGGDDDVTVAPDVSQLITPIVNLGPSD